MRLDDRDCLIHHRFPLPPSPIPNIDCTLNDFMLKKLLKERINYKYDCWEMYRVVVAQIDLNMNHRYFSSESFFLNVNNRDTLKGAQKTGTYIEEEEWKGKQPC